MGIMSNVPSISSGMSWTNWITLIAAIIAALASLYGLRRRALDQIAVNRQVWINNLRDELRTFLSFADEDLGAPSERYNENLEKKNLSQFKIYLLLNPSEASSQLLFSLFSPIKNFGFDPPSKMDGKVDISKLCYTFSRGDFITVSQALLKIEWDRVKVELGGNSTDNEDYGDRFKRALELYLDANKKEIYEVHEDAEEMFKSHKQKILDKFDSLKNMMSPQEEAGFTKRWIEFYKCFRSGWCSL